MENIYRSGPSKLLVFIQIPNQEQTTVQVFIKMAKFALIRQTRFILVCVQMAKIKSEYDQKIPLSQTADKPVAS